MKYTVFKAIPVIKIYLGKQCKNLNKNKIVKNNQDTWWNKCHSMS